MRQHAYAMVSPDGTLTRKGISSITVLLFGNIGDNIFSMGKQSQRIPFLLRKEDYARQNFRPYHV